MSDFETVIQKHGEVSTQALLEDWERHNCIRHAHTVTLEERWARFISMTDTSLFVAA